MRILAAARTLPFHSVGGMQAIAWDLFVEFVRLGHEVTVLTTEIGGKAAPFVSSGVKVVPISGSPAEKYSRAWWQGTRSYMSKLNRSDVDAVLSISVAGAEMATLKSTLNVPFICQLHGTSWGEAVSKWRSGRVVQWLKSLKNLYWFGKDALILRRFDEIVVVGDVVRRQVGERPTRWITEGIPVSTIQNGVDDHVFRFDSTARTRLRQQFGLDDTSRVAIFSARLHPQKGAAECIRAVAKLRARNYDLRLLIVGSGPDETRLRQLAVSSGCADSVLFVGAVSRDQIPAYLSASDVFLFPTLRVEGLPMNVLEAVAVGLPCVISSSLQSIFGSYGSIRYVEPNDPSNIAESLTGTVRGVEGCENALSVEHSLRHCAKSYVDLMIRLSSEAHSEPCR